ncbi:sugar ABC transporter permease [Massilia sp. W12]|uniref:carbohydrate ABC transporter permease n=1 Tax=Massilia sp. W12 TaxID=3126507 RepID=UPI0030CB7074
MSASHPPTARHTLRAWLWLAPALCLLALFSFWPVAYGAWLSFTDYSLGQPAQFVGWRNYRDLLDDPLFINGWQNSLRFLLLVPLMQAAALALALLANQALRGIHVFRMIFYLPVVTTVSVVGIVWGFLLHEQGALNFVLTHLHILQQGRDWLQDEDYAIWAVMFVTLWRGLGWYMVMYLAALQAVSPELLAAARLDGAGAWRRFWHITLPQIRPTLALCSLLSLLAALKTYQEVDVLTQGGPMNSSFTLLYYAYDQGFKHLQLGKGLAASMLASLLCIAVALCLHLARRKGAV